MDAMIERDVLGRARQNFQARNRREDRAWNKESAQAGRVLLILSDRERSEFVDHARYQLEVELRSAVATTQNRAGDAQVQLQGQSR